MDQRVVERASPPPRKLNLRVACTDDFRCDLQDPLLAETFPNLPVEKDWCDHALYVNKRKYYIRATDSEAYEQARTRGPVHMPPRQS